jgi:D-sedoheptulose 7-phosphate isomerase
MSFSSFEGYLTEASEVLEKTKILVPEIKKVSEEMLKTLQQGGTIFWCGNGGSASDAQHLAAELVGRFEVNRPAISSLAITTDTSILTSISNDFSFNDVFSRQVEALGRPSDVIVGITTSGESSNVLNALKAGKTKSMKTFLFTSEKMKIEYDFIDVILKVPSQRTCHIQEAHIAIGQAICGWIENELHGS